jgi:hypothetical protein
MTCEDVKKKQEDVERWIDLVEICSKVEGDPQ